MPSCTAVHGYTAITLSDKILYSDSSNFVNRDANELKRGLKEEAAPSSAEKVA